MDRPAFCAKPVATLWFLLPLLTGCAGATGMIGGAAMGAMGPGTIIPQEKAKFEAMSCAELNKTISGYEAGLSMSGQNPKGKPGQAAQIQAIIGPRLKLLREIAASKGC